MFVIQTPTVELKFNLASRRPPSGVFLWKLQGVEPFSKTTPHFLYPLTFLFPEMVKLFEDQSESMIELSNPTEDIPMAATGLNKLSSQEVLDGYDFHVLHAATGPVVAWRSSDAQSPLEWRFARLDRDDMDEVADMLCNLYAEVVGD